MIRHLFRLTWNRKRSTGLVFIELAGCFLVLCAVATAASLVLDNWRRPLGFRWDDVYRVSLGYGEFYRASDAQRRQAIEGAQRILTEVRGMPEVEAAALAQNVPYDGSTSSWTFDIQGRDINILFGSTMGDLPATLGLRVVRGRWVEPGDAVSGRRALVISENLARVRFGDRDPIGQRLRSNETRPVADDEEDLVVVGVFADYRREGETRAAPYSVFTAARLLPDTPPESDAPPEELLVRVRPGTSAAFEEALARRLQSLVPAWNLDVDAVAQTRDRWLRIHILPLVVAGVVAGFLLLMVGFGLVGVLWQSVAHRTSEIGLRRAVGATARQVRTQIVGELLAVTTIAAVCGSVVFLQLPAIGVFAFVPWQIYVYGLVVAVIVLYCFVVLCALYPGWMATRIHPARALQHE